MRVGRKYNAHLRKHRSPFSRPVPPALSRAPQASRIKKNSIFDALCLALLIHWPSRRDTDTKISAFGLWGPSTPTPPPYQITCSQSKKNGSRSTRGGPRWPAGADEAAGSWKYQSIFVVLLGGVRLEGACAVTNFPLPAPPDETSRVPGRVWRELSVRRSPARVRLESNQEGEAIVRAGFQCCEAWVRLVTWRATLWVAAVWRIAL